MKDWFSVDKLGLAKILERKGKEFVLLELIQNAWDENTTHVTIRIERIPNSPYVYLTVVDDNPTGFSDLSHAFTLFAESAKKIDAAKRGRFNLGEKTVLALCESARICSTKGSVVFDESGRHETNAKRPYGSEFFGKLRMTSPEMDRCVYAMEQLISPHHITTTYVIGDKSGTLINHDPDTAFEAMLATEVADAEGYLRSTKRKTTVSLYPTVYAHAWLYEMGIPVVAIEGRWNVDIAQKVPLNLDRDNVTPAYLARVYALVTEAMHAHLGKDDVNEAWVQQAIQSNPELISDEAAKKILDVRFGEKRVAFDPSDPEANNIAMSQGYTVVSGGAMSGAEWALAKRAEGIKPSGQVTPSRPDATVPRISIPEKDWTGPMARVADFCKAVAPHVIGVKIVVVFSNNSNVSEIASYGSRTLNFNVGRLGYRWFNGSAVKIIDLIIHELAHERSGNHLSSVYYDALTEIGARMTLLALTRPDIFELLDDVAAKHLEQDS